MTIETQIGKQTSREGRCENPFKVDIMFLLAANTYMKRETLVNAITKDSDMLRKKEKRDRELKNN